MPECAGRERTCWKSVGEGKQISMSVATRPEEAEVPSQTDGY